MVKIYHRPDPPPPDVDSNRAVRKTDTFLNREASAGLFQRALVKAQGQEQAVERSKLAGSGQQQQIETDAQSVLGTKARESMLASQSEAPLNDLHNLEAGLNATEFNSGEAADVAELEQMPDDSTEIDSADDDVNSADQAATDTGSTTGLDSSAAFQMFENIQQQSNSTEPEPHSNTSIVNDSNSSEQDTVVNAQVAVAHVAGATAASLESRIDTISGLSDLIDMLETSSQLTDGNEWTLVLEDDGPVSELTLTSDSDGRWNIDLLTSFDSGAVDEKLIGNLHDQLATAGVAVANISLVDSALVKLPS